MLPSFSVNCHMSSTSADIKPLGQFSVRNSSGGVERSHPFYFSFCKTSIPASSPMLGILRSTFLWNKSPLFDHVLHIVAPCPNKQVLGSDASLVVTMMTSKQTFRDWTMGQFPSDTMGSYVMTSQPEYPISIWSQITNPFPASVRTTLINLAPEPFCYWLSFSFVGTDSGATFSPVPCGWADSEGTVAYGAIDKSAHVIPSSFAILLIAISMMAVFETPRALASFARRLEPSLVSMAAVRCRVLSFFGLVIMVISLAQ